MCVYLCAVAWLISVQQSLQKSVASLCMAEATELAKKCSERCMADVAELVRKSAAWLCLRTEEGSACERGVAHTCEQKRAHTCKSSVALLVRKSAAWLCRRTEEDSAGEKRGSYLRKQGSSKPNYLGKLLLVNACSRTEQETKRVNKK